MFFQTNGFLKIVKQQFLDFRMSGQEREIKTNHRTVVGNKRREGIALPPYRIAVQ
jgi:hypothetical protein